MSKAIPGESPAPIPSNWSVIVQADLAASDIGQHLRQRGVKVKRAESVLSGSIIFPRCKVAFMVLELSRHLLAQFLDWHNESTAKDGEKHCPDQGTDMDVNAPGACKDKRDVTGHDEDDDAYRTMITRVDKFTRIHRDCYILLQAPLFTERELAFLYQLQTRYMNMMSVDILICHNAEECVSAMMTISNLQTPPTSDKLHQRFCYLMNELVEPLSIEELAQIDQCEGGGF
ncbi:hypothetical protein EGW08_011324 [Elysia chlorotica]|uniref:Uncharacterized protein n=1 Tax=Elysia chlorotica TaxID=188477 RepID=A0A3S1HJT6_ELYCH|nr:hypothetical protein EGW08_011324 [Elysia chlorotica]